MESTSFLRVDYPSHFKAKKMIDSIATLREGTGTVVQGANSKVK